MGANKNRIAEVTIKTLQVWNKFYTILIIFCLFFNTSKITAQNVQIELGEKTVAIGKPYFITIIITGSDQREYDRFPEIPGMTRRATSTSTSTTIIAGNTESVQRIAQQYVPTQAGNTTIPPFNITVNGQKIESSGGVVSVFAEDNPELATTEVPQEETFVEEIVPEGKAFLSVRSNKKWVFVGDAFGLIISFFVAEDNPVALDFHQLNLQLAGILKKIRPINCWEENFGIQGQPQEYNIVLNKVKYKEYRLFEAVYFPLNPQFITFPVLALNMAVGTGEAKKITPFSSKPVSIQAMPLQKQLLGSSSVGIFQVSETISSRVAQTGKSLQYTISIEGEGNLSPVLISPPINDPLFDFYPPDIEQSILRGQSKITGKKTFTFQIVPKKSGNYPLASYFRWVFFNPQQNKHIEWASGLILRVNGQAVQVTDASRGSDVYSGVESSQSTGAFNNYQEIILSIANAILTILFLGMGFVFWRGKKG